MISVDILQDEGLQKVVNTLISGMLPHRKYSPEYFASILNNTFSYVKLEEFSMEYYVLLKALNELNKIHSDFIDYAPMLTKNIFLGIVEVSADELLTNPCVRIKEYLDYNGLNTNFDNPSTREMAMQKIYSRCSELYDTCFNLEQPSNTAENFIPSYRAAFIAHMGFQSIRVQNAIITSSIQIGRRVYSGFSDWLSYASSSSAEINERLKDVEQQQSLMVVDTLEKVDDMSKELSSTFISIAPWGIPELDGDGIEAGTPILRHRLVVIVGSVNVGKSIFCKDTTTTAIINGNAKVLYMYGEGARAAVWGDLLVNYIYKKFHKFVTVQMLADEGSMDDEIKKIVDLAKIELYQSGTVALREAYSYDNLYQELEDDYKKYRFDVVIIDHSLALKSGGKTNMENVHNLAIACRDFKRKYPVCIIVTSHPSAAAKDFLSKDLKVPGDVAATKESSTLEAEADELFILRENETLIKQDLVALENKKRRNAPRLRENVLLSKMFDVCHFVYDESLQADSSRESLTAEQALRDIDAAYGEDSDDDDYYCL